MFLLCVHSTFRWMMSIWSFWKADLHEAPSQAMAIWFTMRQIFIICQRYCSIQDRHFCLPHLTSERAMDSGYLWVMTDAAVGSSTAEKHWYFDKTSTKIAKLQESFWFWTTLLVFKIFPEQCGNYPLLNNVEIILCSTLYSHFKTSSKASSSTWKSSRHHFKIQQWNE